MFCGFNLQDVRLTDGEFRRRQELVREYLETFDEERLLYNFYKNAGIDTKAWPLGGWEAPDCGLRGHFTGHFLSACARYACTGQSEALGKKAVRIVEALGKCQMENGYLSAFPESVLDVLEEEENRNVWAPYYTLHKILQGLTDCCRFLSNERALQIAIALARYIRERLQRLSFWKRDGILRCTRLNPANEFGGIGDTLYQLYEITGEEWLLETAKLFDRDYFLENLYRGQDVLEDLHANTHLPMILAAMRRYELTGEEKYRIAAENFYHFLKGRTFANGNSSSRAVHYIAESVSETAEHWGTFGRLDDALTGGESESCCAHNTEKIAERLFLWTGDSVYLDHLERLKYNAVFNSASSITGLSQYQQPLGTKMKKKFGGKYDTFWCCMGTGVEAMGELQKNIWFKKEDALLVNLFLPSQATWREKGVTVEQQTEYPDESRVTYKIRTREPVFFAMMWKTGRIGGLTCNKKTVVLRRKGEYELFERDFCDGDILEAEILSSLHLENLQGSEREAVLYDHILLCAAGEASDKRLLEAQAQIRKGDRRDWQDTFLIPLYRVEDETYSVYAPQRE